jgi:hypothetical protein
LWVRFVADPALGPPPQDGVVRVTRFVGAWDLVPVRGGTATHLVYRFQIDLAGDVPRWMVSGGAARDLPRMFQAIGERARSVAPPISHRPSVHGDAGRYAAPGSGRVMRTRTSGRILSVPSMAL